MQKIVKLFILMLGVASAPCIANNPANRLYVSHEIAINSLQSYISFWEILKQRLVFLGYGKKQLTYVSAFLLACACLPFEDMPLEHRAGFLVWAFLVHAPRALLAMRDYFIDIEIGHLRQQINRLIEESECGLEVRVVQEAMLGS